MGDQSPRHGRRGSVLGDSDEPEVADEDLFGEPGDAEQSTQVGQEIENWVILESLPHKVFDVLLDQGITNLEDLRLVPPDGMTPFLLQTDLLPPETCQALQDAIERLALEYAVSCSVESPQPEAGGEEFVHPSCSTEAESEPMIGAESAGSGEPFSAEGGEPFSAGSSEPFAAGSCKPFAAGSDEGIEKFRLLLLGKTGSGKSTTGNTILGQKLFPVGVDFSSVTTDCKLQSCKRGNAEIEIMDCPGLYDTSKSEEEIGTVIVQAVACMHPGPHAVLYVARLGRYTAEEYGSYKRLKALFDENITRYMIVIFTCGDQLEKERKDFSDLLKDASGELNLVLSECTYMVFNNMAEEPHHQVDMLLDLVRQMKQLNGEPYVCPKYKKIGDGLEEEVARRLEEVNRKDLARQKYVQELEEQARAAEDKLQEKKREMARKDAERERQLREDEKRRQRDFDNLMQLLRDQQLDADRRAKKERKYRQRMEAERKKAIEELERQRQRDRDEMARRQRERDRLDAERRKQEREERERRERQHEQEMREMKQRIAKKKEPGFFLKVESLLDMVRRMKRQNVKPYVCPKYKKIGDGLEEEVARRLEEVIRKDLARQKYVQDLEKKTKAAAEELERTKREQQRRERELKLKVEGEERRRKQELEQLIQVMKEQQVSAERRAQKERESLERMEREKMLLIRQLEEQRQRDMEEMQKRQREQQRLEAQRRQREQEERDRRERMHQQEMWEMRQRIAEGREPGFFEICTIS